MQTHFRYFHNLFRHFANFVSFAICLRTQFDATSIRRNTKSHVQVTVATMVHRALPQSTQSQICGPWWSNGQCWNQSLLSRTPPERQRTVKTCEHQLTLQLPKQICCAQSLGQLPLHAPRMLLHVCDPRVTQHLRPLLSKSPVIKNVDH